MLIQSDNPFDFTHALFEFNGLTYLNTLAINIIDLKFIDNLVWFNKTLQSDIRITNYPLMDKKIGKWYNFI